MFGFLRHLFRLQFLLILIAALIGIYYTEISEIIGVQLQNVRDILGNNEAIEVHFESAVQNTEEQLFTKQELSNYNGENETPIYLAILGRVYDVSKGSKHYGIGCEYSYFVGRDASVSFISGEFQSYSEDIADDVLSLKKEDLLGIVNWQKFYAKQYTYKGKLIGRFYDQHGEPTKYYYKFIELVKQAEARKAKVEELRVQFPDCNIEWTPEKGSHVWCSTSSGGITRSWTGLPRKLYDIGSTKFRCACVQKKDLSSTLVMLKQYENCAEETTDCYYKSD